MKDAAFGELFGPYDFALVIRCLAVICRDAGKLDNFHLQNWRVLTHGSGPVGVRFDASRERYVVNDVVSEFTMAPHDQSLPTMQALLATLTDAQARWVTQLARAHGVDVQPSQPEHHMSTTDLNPTVATIVNGALASANLPKIEDLLATRDQYDSAVAQLKAVQSEANRLKAETEDLRSKLTTSVAMPAIIQASASGTWPAYKVELVSAADVFEVPAAHRNSFNLKVPTIVWEGAPPADVPAIDPDYVLRPEPLISTVFGIVTNTNIVAVGETGTGKTTHFEQVAARMRMPVSVINLDSEITRLDIMGRDVLDVSNGASVTRFEEGIVPRAMQRAGFLILDEFDFGRPDVMYALQRLLTGTGITLTEDGGRYIAPHPFFRVMATGNTKGTGDETGFYQGARIQSAAFLNRFGVWIEIGYMSPGTIEELLKKRVPGLSDAIAKQVAQYTAEHQRAFTERNVTVPFSMRDAVHMARSLSVFASLLDKTYAIQFAVKQTVLNRATAQDAATLKGIADRIFA